MAFDPTKVSSPVHNIVLDQDDVAYYTDTLGNKIPCAVAVIPDQSNNLHSLNGAGVLVAADLETHSNSGIEEMSRQPFFKSAGGQKIPMLALLGFDASKNLLPPSMQSSMISVSVLNLATGGAVGTAAATVDVADLILVAQTTAAQTLTIPSPTQSSLIRKVIVGNSGSASFTLLGQTVAAGAALGAVWNGSAWMYVA